MRCAVTQYDYPAQRDLRSLVGGAVVSERRAWLREQLQAAGIGFRFLLLQSTTRGNIIPALLPPVIIDTVGMPLATVVGLFDDLQAMKPLPPTVVVVAPEAVGQQRLALLCPAVYALVTDALLPNLRPLITHMGVVGRQRYSGVVPLCLGFTPAPLARAVDATVIPVLAVLTASRTFDEAAATMTMSTRTLHRKLATLRTQLGLPSATSTRYRPQEVVDALLDAIADASSCEASRTAA